MLVGCRKFKISYIMVKSYRNEKWKYIEFDEGISEHEKFKISNYGRILNCKGKEEVLVKGSCINGYPTLPLSQRITGKSTSRYVHKLVAQHFLEKKEASLYVIHLNYDKKDNRASNLRWATKEEKERHQFSHPRYKQISKRITNSKLTEAQVKLLKRKINDPNRKTRLKIIAKQFGISEMQLHRIKTGENWGHISEY